MRTVKFKDVFDRVVRLHGRDPRKELSSDLANAIVDHINDRVNTIWQGWRWPEWERTEERAFRTVWNDSRQFLRADSAGNPDEVYYIPTSTYYRVISDAVSDPPVGTAPTDGSFFEVITPLDTFIEYDQACKRAIGIMRGIYRCNPRVPTGSNYGLLNYMPSERGLDVRCPGVPTVWITYSKPAPTFTMTPYVDGKTYERAEIVFYPATGECFQALIATSAVPTNATYWSWIPFPEVWSDYVEKGSFADSLMEFNQGGNGDLQAKFALQQYWNQQADDSLQQEVDTLVTQGQSLRWNFGGLMDGWRKSLPWYGGDVISILSSPFASIVTEEVPSGVIDGGNTAFTTAYRFSTLWVFLNGVRQTKNGDYTLNAPTGFTMTNPPQIGDALLVDYIRI